MIVHCEICQTKYNIEDSKITPEGVKVRCAKCKNIFSVTPALPTPVTPSTPPSPDTSPTPEPGGGDFLQDLESFEKFHKELMDTSSPETMPPPDEGSPFETGGFDTGSPDTGVPPPEPSPEGPSMEEFPTEEWPAPPLEEQRPTESVEGEMEPPSFDMGGLQEERYFEKPRVIPKKRKTSRFFVLIGILLIVALGAYYLWSERGMEFSLPENIPSFFKSIPERLQFVPEKLQFVPEKFQSILDNIRGIEKGSLTFTDLEGNKDIIGEIPVFVITGQILNETNKTKKHVRIKAILLSDKNKVLVEKQTLCGLSFSNKDLNKLSARFKKGNFNIRPRPDQMRVAPRMSVPFIVIFPNIPPDAQEFQVEIVESPNA
ncbi:MAG: zinc-ribbon domain-containing protein [Syntrophobacterales bacterium]|nr:MAG: zinc-ribbon domain-containing protein [Syntrophobacterales bacterium]